jgi:uncharacterized protein (TIGR02265 family)
MSMINAAAEWAGAPVGWGQELEQRVPLASPADSVRGMFLNAILGAVRGLGNVEALRRCQEACGEPEYVDFLSYPVSDTLRLLSAAVEAMVGRNGGSEGALRLLGRRAGADLLETAAGKTLALFSRGDARRVLSSLPSVYRVSLSFGERTVEWTGPKSGRVTFKRDFLPAAFHEGVLLELLERVEIKGSRVRGRQVGTLDSEYDISWV